MKKLVLGAAAMVSAALLAIVQGGPAFAADNVSDGRTAVVAGGLGSVTVIADFDNTNCDANSTANCVSLNGAKLSKIRVYSNETPKRSIGSSNVPLKIDVYGDGTSNYISTTYTLNFSFVTTGEDHWEATPSSSFRADINRVCVKLWLAGTSSSSGGNVGGMNPYGLSQSGSCGI